MVQIVREAGFTEKKDLRENLIGQVPLQAGQKISGIYLFKGLQKRDKPGFMKHPG